MPRSCVPRPGYANINSFLAPTPSTNANTSALLVKFNNILSYGRNLSNIPTADEHKYTVGRIVRHIGFGPFLKYIFCWHRYTPQEDTIKPLERSTCFSEGVSTAYPPVKPTFSSRQTFRDASSNCHQCLKTGVANVLKT